MNWKPVVLVMAAALPAEGGTTSSMSEQEPFSRWPYAIRPSSISAGTDCKTVRSVSRAISSFGLPSIWPHMEPDASSTMMVRSAAVETAFAEKRKTAAARPRKRNAMSISR